MNALLSSFRGGPSAGSNAAQTDFVDIDYAEVKRLKEAIFTPIRREDGISPTTGIEAVQSVVCPVKYNLRKSDELLREAISKIEQTRESFNNLFAKDLHYLGKCHEATSMALCAEISFRSSLFRTESRGWHYREDYPERDDRNWLKWVIVKQSNEAISVYSQPVPTEQYKYKP